jgi:hypothetical protein
MQRKSEPDPGAITITPADGYQFGDDHVWDAEKQAGLVTQLSELINDFDTSHQDPYSEQGTLA